MDRPPLTLLLIAWAIRWVLVVTTILALPAIAWLVFWVCVFSMDIPKKQKRAPK